MRVWWLSTFAVLWTGCESDKVVVEDGVVYEDTACDPGNYPPFVEITSHSDATVIPDGTTEEFVALVGDCCCVTNGVQQFQLKPESSSSAVLRFCEGSQSESN